MKAIRLRRKLSSLAVLAAALVFTGCEESVTGPRASRISLGVWGGESAGLVVTADGATADFGCSSGKIETPLVADVSGRFEVTGTIVFAAGVPDGPAHPARFVGRVEGDTLTLEARILEPAASIGPVTLRFGQPFTGPHCA